MDPRKPGTTRTATILPFPDRPREVDQQKILQLSPEYEGLCLLYSHHALSHDKLYAIKILCWARLADGSVVALVPWLKGIARCIDLDNPESGCAEGYYCPRSERRFSDAPEHHQRALEVRATYPNNSPIVQEIPDLTGSHAALIHEDNSRFQLEPVVSWQLNDKGEMTAMLADTSETKEWPILPGSDCLYPATEENGFRYFFQYHIANQIKSGGVMATRALSKLITP
ncbi:hypothetical protein IB286_11500 [Spongiibacter sp. KMU-158]|uniref:Uncharacterized protein n=1 Tax=Spongiibacter pelagi TaxID=2760804 RepID=A0A927C4C0_9GAMM|nr:hypothetical protein [Spongiibacter pelagi]MBD2859632.1 hypothetical protein [Spongiibacter pelagi]